MRRDRLVLSLVGLVAALGASIASGRVWYRVTGHGFTGSEITDKASQALPLAALAGIALTLLLGVWGRRIAGLLITVLGAGLVAVAASRHVPSSSQLETTVGSAMATGSTTHTHLVSLVCGVLVAVCGLGFMLRSHHWRPATDRFDRRPTVRRDVTNSLDAWKAMDAGADPTDVP